MPRIVDNTPKLFAVADDGSNEAWSSVYNGSIVITGGSEGDCLPIEITPEIAREYAKWLLQAADTVDKANLLKVSANVLHDFGTRGDNSRKES